MRSFSIGRGARTAVLVLAAAALSACGLFGHRGKSDVVTQASNIPASFDVTLLADKDNQFDFDGAPLTTDDLKSALRYRQEENLPVSTVLLKRGEKQKIKAEHQVALARVAYQLKFRAFFEDDGVISELQARAKDETEAGKTDAAKTEPAKKD